MRTYQINWTDIKAKLFISVMILTLAIYQTLDSPIELRQDFPLAIFGWHLFTMILITGSTMLLDQQIFRNWFRCSFSKLIGARLSLYLVLSVMLTGTSIAFYDFLLNGSANKLGFLTAFVFYVFIYFITSVSLEVSKLV